MFDLHPGDYVVMAAAGNNMGGPEIEGEAIGLAPSYSPGVATVADATRIRLGRGTEITADIRLIETRVFSLSGTVVTSSGEPASGGSISVVSRDAALNASFGTGLSGTGTFTLRNLPPGAYELVARPQPSRPPGAPGTGSASVQEFGSVQIDLAADTDHLLIATTTGATVRGEAVFDEPLPPAGRFTITPGPPGPRNFSGVPAVEIAGTQFTLKGVFGPTLLSGNASGGPRSWALKAVLLRGQDVTDEPTPFTSSDSGHLQVVFTSKAPALEGAVTLDDGRPALDATVILFGQDLKTWKPRSSFNRTTVVGKDGKFTVRGLREGRYYAAAVPPDVMAGFGQPTPEFLGALLAAGATAVTVNDGEIRTLDLRVLRFEKP